MSRDVPRTVTLQEELELLLEVEEWRRESGYVTPPEHQGLLQQRIRELRSELAKPRL